MRRIVSLGLITLTAFFMSGCDLLGDVEIDDLPGIELAGDSVMEVLQYSEFVDPGAQILGDFDLDVVSETDLDTSILGDYTITYTITYLTIEYNVSRTVRVVEELSGEHPSLELIGDSIIEVEQYSVFVDPGIGIIGNFDLDITVVSDVDTSVLGTYTITYTVTYLEIEYSLSRTVEVVMEIVTEDPSVFFITFTEGEVTQTTITVNLVVVDDDAMLSGRFVKLYKDDVEVGSLEYVVGNNVLEFTGLDSETDYEVKVVGDYLYAGTTMVVSGYSLDIETLSIGELSFTIDNSDFVLSMSSVEFAVDVVDEDELITSMSINIYLDDVLVETISLSEGNNFIIFDELVSETDYEVEIEYTYLPHGETTEVTVKLDKMDYTTLESIMPEVISNVCNETYYHLECVADIDYTGFEGMYIWAVLYKNGVTYKTEMLDDNYTTFDFRYIDVNTDYVVKIYGDYTHSSTSGIYTQVLLGTYEVSTLTVGDYDAPLIENVVITEDGSSITVEFDINDVDNGMDRGYIRLVIGSSIRDFYYIQDGHNSFTFNNYIYENTLYTLRWDIDYTGSSTFPTVYSEDIFILPVITVNSFEQTEMFYENDYVIMKLDLDNDEEVVIDFVTINGVRYDTFNFPSDIDTLYVNMGVYSSAGNYVMNLDNVIITVNEIEYAIDLVGSDEVPVYLVGAMAPSDATVEVIDIVPVDYFVIVDFDNPYSISTVLVNIYFDNPYNLPVSSVTIGGVTYTGTNLTVVNNSQVQITAEFSYNNSPSNNTLYFYSVTFERNGSIVVYNQTSQTDVRIYKIYDFDNDDETPSIVHISTPADLMAIEADSVSPATVFVLDNDIDMSGYNFFPIGTAENPFTGAFDGNGFTISNLTINKTFGAGNGYDYVGMFGKSSAFIVDLVLENVTINVTTTADNLLYIGALSGLHTGDINNVHVYNSTITVDGLISGAIGGLSGQHHGDIIGSSADTDITTTESTSESTSYVLYVGGLVGIKAYEDIRNSFATGDIMITSDTVRTVFAGGLVGQIYGGEAYSPNYIMNSYATGNVSSETDYYGRTGGLVGVVFWTSTSYIQNSYASGDVDAIFAGTTGGLVGQTSTYVVGSFAIGNVNGLNGTLSRLFGSGNDYRLTDIYAYDGQVVSRDNDPIGGSDSLFFPNIGIASDEQFDDANYYLDFLGWSTHFFDFTNLDVSNKIVPTLK